MTGIVRERVKMDLIFAFIAIVVIVFLICWKLSGVIFK